MEEGEEPTPVNTTLLDKRWPRGVYELYNGTAGDRPRRSTCAPLSEVPCDIVLIHGVKGHPLKTWCIPEPEDPEGLAYIEEGEGEGDEEEKGKEKKKREGPGFPAFHLSLPFSKRSEASSSAVDENAQQQPESSSRKPWDEGRDSEDDGKSLDLVREALLAIQKAEFRPVTLAAAPKRKKQKKRNTLFDRSWEHAQKHRSSKKHKSVRAVPPEKHTHRAHIHPKNHHEKRKKQMTLADRLIADVRKIGKRSLLFSEQRKWGEREREEKKKKRQETARNNRRRGRALVGALQQTAWGDPVGSPVEGDIASMHPYEEEEETEEEHKTGGEAQQEREKVPVVSRHAASELQELPQTQNSAKATENRKKKKKQSFAMWKFFRSLQKMEAKKMEAMKIWPEEFLAEDFPRSRILSCAHDVKLVARPGQVRLPPPPRLLADWWNNVRKKEPKELRKKSEELKTLARELARLLKEKGLGSGGRPVVIISHSLGGVLAKHLFLEMEELRPQVRQIVFFAVPHKGTPHAENLNVLCSKEVKELKRPDMEVLNNKFAEEWQRDPTRTACNYLEGQPWRAGTFPVPFDRAEDERYGEAMVMKAEDHVSICKLGSKEDQRYRKVTEQMKEAIEPYYYALPAEKAEETKKKQETESRLSEAALLHAPLREEDLDLSAVAASGVTRMREEEDQGEEGGEEQGWGSSPSSSSSLRLPPPTTAQPFSTKRREGKGSRRGREVPIAGLPFGQSAGLSLVSAAPLSFPTNSDASSRPQPVEKEKESFSSTRKKKSPPTRRTRDAAKRGTPGVTRSLSWSSSPLPKVSLASSLPPPPLPSSFPSSTNPREGMPTESRESLALLFKQPVMARRTANRTASAGGPEDTIPLPTWFECPASWKKEVDLWSAKTNASSGSSSRGRKKSSADRRLVRDREKSLPAGVVQFISEQLASGDWGLGDEKERRKVPFGPSMSLPFDEFRTRGEGLLGLLQGSFVSSLPLISNERAIFFAGIYVMGLLISLPPTHF
uniref:GPI inositol-deacylase n=1 Tax=Chromera velia CCMP2878 TaxID=1169474 RepID=A0A0G4FS44_9ALVE|eukprot:Cvel_18493.t1-p1 / transcript=Cvel_18493.t1 / gene=Cvel_18493 / organism=Chromera_velia_CCMP2878 / gene_product=Protein SERAC1, putative / transcript_product=Protein SERAC1, putative / location=Cvel_scaffold1534:36233-43039(-) / protein_length=1006 / sequence_SO=supercontig / SO=protein_coding / is_pseudo=false